MEDNINIDSTITASMNARSLSTIIQQGRIFQLKTINPWTKLIPLTQLMYVNERQRILKGQSKMNNSEKLATQGRQDEENKTKTHHNIVGHHYTQIA